MLFHEDHHDEHKHSEARNLSKSLHILTAMAGHEIGLLALADEKLSFVVYFAVLRSAHDVLDVH
jgi:hypothetical protein